MTYSSRRCLTGQRFCFFSIRWEREREEKKKKKSLIEKTGLDYSEGDEKRKAKKVRMKTSIVVDSWDIDIDRLLKKKREKKKKDIALCWGKNFERGEKPGKFKDINRIRKEIKCISLSIIIPWIYSHEDSLRFVFCINDDVWFPFLFCLTLSIEFWKRVRKRHTHI